ncbi:hypothetical protein F5984_22135 [Rudanella paleaurantiibacter]|uniref:DUF481 domain-containing protein n=1 Tax=Rudanella paleaurantiibacter TaxID=2614655 RepID=A0A7J5TTV5_9BACT|nr:hypothetical protein [Rudanella paleaurantiibacter]KAB7727328.1 hypothetical protein F5984_22135 [Rudanella paleaurantiibacter]
MFSITQRLALFLALWSCLSGCASLNSRDDIRALNRIYRVRAGQTLYQADAQGGLTEKRLNQPADAALYQRADTLFAAFDPHTLPPSDGNPTTFDQGDSASLLFVHYKPRLRLIEEKSPWFYYQLTSFDIDLFTVLFKYRFPQRDRPGQLATSANIGVYTGIRYDLGRFRNIYLRGEQRSDVQSFSFGIGSVLSIDPVLVNEFNTNGLITTEYEALGVNYGLATIVGYKSVTAGLAVGFENLADRNNRAWVYRQKPWLGFTVGININ